MKVESSSQKSINQQSKLPDKLKMDFIQKITLSPFEKYIRFGRFPWKFICHLLLVILTTYQAMKIVTIQDKHTRIQQQIFSTIYLQNDDGSSSYPYYSLSDFTDTFFQIINQTNSLNQTLLQYSIVDDVQYRLEIYYSEINQTNIPFMIIQGDQQQFVDQLSRIPITYGNYAQMKKFLQNVQNMNLYITNITTYISVDDQGNLDSCLNWTINIGYSFQSFANVEGSLEAQSLPCMINNQRVDLQESIFTIHIAIMIVASLSLFLAWRQIYYISKEYMYYKQRLGSKAELGQSRFRTHVHWQKTWEELGFFQKLRFFDFWFVIITAGNFFQFFGALIAILDDIFTTKLLIFQHKEVLIGFGVMLAWITILKYLEYSSNLNLMTSTLSKSWSNLFMFLLGVLPFFLGFVFLGQTIFWKYNKFQDTSSSIITLFSLLNGDIVNDTFLETWAQGLAGQFYLIIFMILFYTAVQNVFITIIMQGYEQSIKQRDHKKRLQEKQKKDQQEFQQNLLNLTQMEEIQAMKSPQLTPQQNLGMSKIRINGKKIDKILSQMEKVSKEIEESDLPQNQKKYLGKMMKDNLESIVRSIKIQLREIQREQ